MKKITILFIGFVFAIAIQSVAQICDPPCVPDVACVDVEDPGQICPEVLPPAHVDEYYDETVTVVPPATFNIAGTDYDIAKVSLTDVAGLPTGMSWCKSEEFFAVTEPYTRYCCQLTGTSDQVGEYPLTLTIVPYYSFFGTEIELPPQTDDTSLVVIVLPAAPVADFSANPTSTSTGTEVVFTDESSNDPTGWDWVFEGGTPATSDVQNPIVTYAGEGTFDVTLIVSNDGGSDELTMSDYITISDGTGIVNDLSQNIKLYPNPATHQITVEAEGLETITILDMLGQVVYSCDVNSSSKSIDVSKLGKANYFVKIVTTTEEVTKSITIK